MSELFTTSTVGRGIYTRLEALETAVPGKLPLTGGLLTGGMSVGDSNFALNRTDPNNPILAFDASDSLGYARSTDLYGFNIGGTTVCSITTVALTHLAKITAPLLAAGDANFNLAIAGANAICTFDTGDAIYFNRTTNKLYIQIGGVNVASIDASGNMKLAGALTQNTTP